MKCGNSCDIIHKDVVVVGNGPSGIALSYMLSGNIPYITSCDHPDELLAARLKPVVDTSLVHQDLGHLASGLEGRTTNPVSLLLDSLTHPYADIGWEMDPLIEWRNNGQKIDHVVLGKGPPGGSWHSMDPQILTLSLGSWMALPGLKYESRNASEKRASAKNVAEYYERYVRQMGLERNFMDHMVVTGIRPIAEECKSRWVEKVNSDICQKVKLCSRPEPKEKALNRSKSCTLSNAFNYLLFRNERKRTKEPSPERSIREILDEKRVVESRCKRDTDRSVSFSCDDCDSYNKYENNNKPRVPKAKNCDSIRWIVEAVDLRTRNSLTFTCNHLVLANGSSDLPNRLSIPNFKTDPYWLTHDLKSLEIELDLYLENNPNPDPVMIVGAGLSAADAIIATRARNVPVLHVFRNRSANLSKQLPENMYPEYHKVHEMMKNSSNYPLYTALPEYSLTDFEETSHTVTLTSKEGKDQRIKVAFAAVLIGSRPDLTFLPKNYNLAAKKHLPVDCKKNTVNIDKLTHSVHGYEGLYAMGPLAGDNFVRFLPGGALAVLSSLYHKNGF